MNKEPREDCKLGGTKRGVWCEVRGSLGWRCRWTAMGWRTPGTRDRDAASLDCQLGERTVMHLTRTACSALSAITVATNRPTRQRVSTGRARGGRRGALLSRRTKGGFVPTIAHVHILLMLTSAASPDPSSCNARDNCVQPPAREAYQQLSAAGRRGSDKPCAPERHGSAVEQHARMARARCGTRSPWSNAPGEARACAVRTSSISRPF